MPIPTWYHAVQTLDVILCDPTFCANLVNKSGDEAHDCVCNIVVLRVLKATLGVITLCNTACNAEGRNKSSNKCQQFSWWCTSWHLDRRWEAVGVFYSYNSQTLLKAYGGTTITLFFHCQNFMNDDIGQFSFHESSTDRLRRENSFLEVSPMSSLHRVKYFSS